MENKVTMQTDPCITNICQFCSRKLYKTQAIVFENSLENKLHRNICVVVNVSWTDTKA